MDGVGNWGRGNGQDGGMNWVREWWGKKMEELGGWGSRVGGYGKKGCRVEGKFPSWG